MSVEIELSVECTCNTSIAWRTVQHSTRTGWKAIYTQFECCCCVCCALLLASISLKAWLTSYHSPFCVHTNSSYLLNVSILYNGSKYLPTTCCIICTCYVISLWLNQLCKLVANVVICEEKQKIWSRTELIRKHNRIAQKNKWAFFFGLIFFVSLNAFVCIVDVGIKDRAKLNAVAKVVYRLAICKCFPSFFSSSFRFNVNRVQNVANVLNEILHSYDFYLIHSNCWNCIHNSRFVVILGKIGKSLSKWGMRWLNSIEIRRFRDDAFSHRLKHSTRRIFIVY